jgi:hypothetical protein
MKGARFPFIQGRKDQLIVSSFDRQPPGQIKSCLGFFSLSQALDRFDVIPTDSTQVFLHLSDPISYHTPSQRDRKSQERGGETERC